MQVATRRGSRHDDTRSLIAAGLARPAAVLRGRWLAPLLAGVGLLVAVLLNQPAFAPAQLAVVDDGGQLRVSGVPVGSMTWSQGVRRGMPVAPVAGGDSTFEIETGGRVTGLTTWYPDQPPLMVTVAAALLVAGLVVPAFGLPGGPLLVTLAAALSLRPVYDRLGLPAAYPWLLVPVITAVAASGWFGHRKRARVAVAAIVGLAGVFVAANVIGEAPWRVLWELPGAMAIGLVGVQATHSLFRMLRAPVRAPKAGFLDRLQHAASELVPIAQSSRLAGRDEERARVASQIHSEVLPEVVLSLRALERQRADEAAATLSKLDEDLRQLVLDRHGGQLDAYGLAVAVRSLVDASVSRDVPVRFEIITNDGRPPRDVEVAAYRVAQEALNNAIRHSGADVIAVRLAVASRRLELRVSDDGVGIDPDASDQALRRGHVGLAEMRARAARVGAVLSVRRAADAGTEVVLRWRG